MKIVDPHVHFYDMEHPDLVYGHWQPGVPHPSLGWQIQKLSERNYLAEDQNAQSRSELDHSAPLVTDEILETLRAQVVSNMTDSIVREITADVVAEVAERLVRAEIARMKFTVG